MKKSQPHEVVTASTAVMAALSIGVVAASAPPAPSNAMQVGMGVNQFGMTQSYFNGRTVSFTTPRAFTATSPFQPRPHRDAKLAPRSRSHRQRASTRCTSRCPWLHGLNHVDGVPTGLVCVDHPGTIDLSRLEPDLKRSTRSSRRRSSPRR